MPKIGGSGIWSAYNPDFAWLPFLRENASERLKKDVKEYHENYSKRCDKTWTYV